MTTPKSTQRSPRIKDLAGQTFGRLTVVSLIEKQQGVRHASWLCRCDCGETRVIRSLSLVQGATRSCGCLHRESCAETGRASKKHGMCKTSEYCTWKLMICRCCNPNTPAYPKYGGRGITVCDRWRNSFANFFADMGPKPTAAHTIDRIDNSGDYEPSNCRWASKQEQNRNRRNRHMIEFRGETRMLAEWSEITGIHCGTILHRLSKGWSVEDALMRPVDMRKSNNSRGTAAE